MSGSDDTYTLGMVLGVGAGFCIGVIATSLVWYLSSILIKAEKQMQDKTETIEDSEHGKTQNMARRSLEKSHNIDEDQNDNKESKHKYEYDSNLKKIKR